MPEIYSWRGYVVVSGEASGKTTSEVDQDADNYDFNTINLQSIVEQVARTNAYEELGLTEQLSWMGYYSRPTAY